MSEVQGLYSLIAHTDCPLISIRDQRNKEEETLT